MGASASTEFDVTVTHTATQIPVIALVGELDFYTSPMLRKALAETVAQYGPWVVLDVAGLTFINSTGLGAFIRALQQCRHAGGGLVLARLRKSHTAALKMAGVLHLFEVCATVEAADSALNNLAGKAAAA